MMYFSTLESLGLYARSKFRDWEDGRLAFYQTYGEEWRLQDDSPDMPRLMEVARVEHAETMKICTDMGKHHQVEAFDVNPDRWVELAIGIFLLDALATPPRI